MMTSVDLIRYAIADQVRELGGDTDKIDQIAMSAAYAIFFIGMAADASRQSR